MSQVGEQAVNVARNAWLSAGLPESVPGTTIDRQCGSSQQAIHFAAQGVMAGAYDLVVAAGVESMTRVPMFSTLQGGYGTPLTTDIAQRYQLDYWFNQAEGPSGLPVTGESNGLIWIALAMRATSGLGPLSGQATSARRSCP